MLIYGDVESVNLSTGERFRRVSGNGESRLMPVHPITHQYPVSEEEWKAIENARNILLDKLVATSYREKAVDTMKEVKLGQHVVWHESDGRPADAIVPAVWGPKCVNLVIVSLDENRKDEYGRQIERKTSCSYKDMMNVHGFYWRFPEDEPNSYIPPQQV